MAREQSKSFYFNKETWITSKTIAPPLSTDFQEITYLPQCSPASAIAHGLKHSFATAICYFAPSLVRALQQTLSQSSSSYCCSFASHVDPWTASHLAAARKHAVSCKHAPVGINTASQKGMYIAVQGQKARFSSRVPFSRQTWSSQPCCSTVYLTKDLVIHLCKRGSGQQEHLIKHGVQSGPHKRAGSQILWIQATGQREPTMHCGHGEALRLQSTVLLQMKTPAWQNTVLSFVTEQDNLLS